MSAVALRVALRGVPHIHGFIQAAWLHMLPRLVYFTTLNNCLIVAMSALSYPVGSLQIHNLRHQKNAAFGPLTPAPNKALGHTHTHRMAASALAPIYLSQLSYESLLSVL